MSGPLDQLTRVVERLIDGETQVRADVDGDAPELKAMVRAVNALADELARSRAQQDQLVRLNAAARRIGVRIRQQPSVDAALAAVARGLGDMLAADQVLVGYVDPEGACTTGGWVMSGVATGDLAAALEGVWTAVSLSESWRTADLAGTAEVPVPAGVRAALLAAGAGPVLLIPFITGNDERRRCDLAPLPEAMRERSGMAVLLRSGGAGLWSQPEIEAAESVVAGLGRSLQQIQLYQREHDLVAQLRELDQAKTQFMWTVSHELRTPLASIVGYVESLRDGDAGPVQDVQDRMLAIIQRNADRLRGLIENLLQMSRIEAGVLVPHVEPVDLAQLISHSVQTVGPAAARAGVSIQIRTGECLRAYVDCDQIERVLCNLLSNAVKFTPSGGLVHIGADRDGDELAITVADTGIGVPEADKAQLFTRFFRASNAVSRVIPGTGLGLAIAQTIVANHHGRMDLASTEGVGTTVTVHLPGKPGQEV